MARLEKQEEEEIRTWCKEHHVLFIKFTPKGEIGWPDRIAIFPGGFHLWTELKKRGEKPEPIQYYRMGQLREKDAAVEWFDNAEDCIAHYQEVLNVTEELEYTDGRSTES